MRRTATLTAGLRDLLIALDIGPVVIGPLKETPDACVGLTPYPIDDDLDTGTVLQAVQVHVRGTTTGGVQPVLDTQDLILDAIGNIRMDVIGGISTAVAWRQMSAPLAPDGRGRPEIRDTYYLRTDRLGTAG